MSSLVAQAPGCRAAFDTVGQIGAGRGEDA